MLMAAHSDTGDESHVGCCVKKAFPLFGEEPAPVVLTSEIVRITFKIVLLCSCFQPVGCAVRMLRVRP